MDSQTQEWLRWALGGLGTLALVYAGWTHRQINEERKERNQQVNDLHERLNVVDGHIATASQNAALLTELRRDVKNLSEMVYLIAGKLGVQIRGV